MNGKAVLVRLVLPALIALCALLVLAPGAAAKVIEVNQGESIQAAVDAAEPGDTIVVKRGTYEENVTVTKTLTIQGDGAKLVPPQTPAQTPCDNPDNPTFTAGFCVAGQVDFQSFTVTSFVENVRIRGFWIGGFNGSGILAIGARNAVFKHNTTVNNYEYGIFALLSTGTKIQRNVAAGHMVAGIYVGDSPEAKAVVKGNTVYDNSLGMFFRNARMGTYFNNTITGNCLGIIVTADAPGPAGSVSIIRNLIGNNTKACPPVEEEELPPISGLGIVLDGADDVKVRNNIIVGNRPSGPTIASAGVVLIQTGQGTAPSDNTIRRNTILRNELDILTDGSGTGNVFARNICRTSNPATLC